MNGFGTHFCHDGAAVKRNRNSTTAALDKVQNDSGHTCCDRKREKFDSDAIGRIGSFCDHCIRFCGKGLIVGNFAFIFESVGIGDNQIEINN